MKIKILHQGFQDFTFVSVKQKTLQLITKGVYRNFVKICECQQFPKNEKQKKTVINGIESVKFCN